MKVHEVTGQLENLLSESRYMAGAKDAEQVFQADVEALELALAILHDYEQQSEQIRKDQEQFYIKRKPVKKNGVWLCPKCRRRIRYNHSYCHWCGKKLGWQRGNAKV